MGTGFGSRTLRAIASTWGSHIQTEEQYLTLDCIEAAIRPGQVAERGQQHFGSPLASVPFLLYSLEPEDRAAMVAPMPPEVTQHLVPVVWKGQWAAMKPFLLD